MTNEPISPSDPPPIEHAPLKAICSICGYNIGGVICQPDQSVICPECGHTLRPSDPDHLFTKSKLKKLIFKQLILVPFVMTIITIVSLPIPLFNTLMILVYGFVFPIAVLILYLFTTSELMHKSKPHPQPYTRWKIPFITFGAIIPSIICYIITLMLAVYFSL